MPCAAPVRGKLDTKLPWVDAVNNDPCGKPIVTYLGIVNVSADNLCLGHQAFKRGVADVPRWITMEGDTFGWGAAEVSGTLALVDPVYNILAAATISPLPNTGELVKLRVGTVVIGDYLVAPSIAAGEFWVQGSRAYFHKVNRAGVDQTAALAALVGTATTLDWRSI